MADPTSSLDDQVRAADPDRWLSSRFVGDPQARADLIALYAFEAELMSIPTRVTQPLLAEMRYVWWREQMDGVFSGVARKGHPVLEALTDLVGRHGLPRDSFDTLIEAHIDRVHGEPHDLDAFYRGPMQVAVQILAGASHDAEIVEASRVWSLSQVGRADEADALRVNANRLLASLPAVAFPAVAHAALKPDTPEALKRLKLTWATLRGRI
ncbi:squalene/phytoene synthase family protein [Brevundimonas sp.]|uniref:squalene/phytoene synthase family protein n=1 Tax=Brevundimonas sp. TaxID=1871086 RepID=UPI003D150632